MDSQRSPKSAINRQKATKSAAYDIAETNIDNSISSVFDLQGSTIGCKIMNSRSSTKCSPYLAKPAISQQEATDSGRAVTDVVHKDSSELADNNEMFESSTFNIVDVIKRRKDQRENVIINSQMNAEHLARSASNARARANMRRKMYNKQLALLSDIPNSQLLDSLMSNLKSTVDHCELIAVRGQKEAELAAKNAANIRASIHKTQKSFDDSVQELVDRLGIDNIP